MANYLLKRDVEIITSVQVTNYENGTMTLSDNSTLETMNVFWVAGVRANSIDGLAKKPMVPVTASLLISTTVFRVITIFLPSVILHL